MTIKELLPDDDEWWKLKAMRSHYLTGEGGEESYDVCKELSEMHGIMKQYYENGELKSETTYVDGEK